MNPSIKRFKKNYEGVADAIARADLDQEDREELAAAVADSFAAKNDPDFRRDLFVLLASDPLVPCAGFDHYETGDHVDCPEGRLIRIGMHLSDAPDGRSRAWRRRAPYGRIRCVSCGAAHFSPGYQEARV